MQANIEKILLLLHKNALAIHKLGPTSSTKIKIAVLQLIIQAQVLSNQKIAKYDVSQAERSHVPPLPGPSQA